MRTKLPAKKISVVKVNHLEAGRKIRQLREKANMSLRRLAKEMGFTPPYISDLELGKRNWTPELFDKAISIVSK